MIDTPRHTGGVGKPTPSPNADKIPDTTGNDSRRKGESRQIAGEAGGRAPQKDEKADTRRDGGQGASDDDRQEHERRDADRENAILGRTAEGRR